MLILAKLSFRQLLLGVFVLIAFLLGATSVNALLTLDRLTKNSRDAGGRAVVLTQNAQRLEERSVAMERSARQYLVLNDTAFRDRYADAWREAGQALGAIETGVKGASAPDIAEWRRQSATAWDILQNDRGHPVARQQALSNALAYLPPINARLMDEAKGEVDNANHKILMELEQRRGELTGQVIGSIVIAAVLATSFGLWLSRPLTRIEVAIDQLGANRFDQPIDVEGPSDLRRVGRQLDWLRQRLVDLEADKERFLRHISHELKTPLAALREGVALLEDELVGELSVQQREITGILRQNTASLQTQIEDLLRYNAATFEAHHLERHSTDIAVLLQKVIESQRLQWQAQGVAVLSSGHAGTALLDADKIAAVLANLLSNAVRFSPRGGEIRFELSEALGYLILDCRDQGSGVAPTDTDRIFEPFYQGERQPAGGRNGNGIGLSIVREYVGAHGGTVQLLSSAEGAHFQMKLPLEV